MVPPRRRLPQDNGMANSSVKARVSGRTPPHQCEGFECLLQGIAGAVGTAGDLITLGDAQERRQGLVGSRLAGFPARPGALLAGTVGSSPRRAAMPSVKNGS